MQWRTISETDFKTRRFDDDLTVYHIPSGNTHLLGRDAARILALLSGEAGDAASLAHAIAAFHGIEAAEPLIRQVEGILADLASLDLIEPVRS